ncbi:MAG: sigma-70 family RNA polymerase sigma factor [Oscillospiraceae bacterium]|nr:sigma-70 family RNA polymerase sigma factor [Oscillospiraceae bacterium]
MTDADFETAVEKIRNHDKTGLRDIYDAYGDKIYRLFLNRIHNHQDAEDLTSDFFLKIWECVSFYQSGQGHRCWLASIARNMAIDYQRRASKNIPVEDNKIINSDTFTEYKTAEDTTIGKLHMKQLLNSLSQEEQEIVEMHIGAELTFREIASILKRPLGTVAWKYRNAIGKLQKLAKEGQLI